MKICLHDTQMPWAYYDMIDVKNAEAEAKAAA